MLAWVVALTVVIACVAGGLILGGRLRTHSAASAPTPATKPDGSPAPKPDPATDPLAAGFDELADSLDAKLGMVVIGVGPGKTAVALGDWDSGPAWSTIKVPLAIAGLRESGAAEPTDAMVAAITRSDNDAAEQIWESLGDPATAAQKVQAVLSSYGDPTVVESRRVRPEFSAFGQTEWSLAHQATFLAHAVCDPSNQPILDLMGQVASPQQWGLGVIPGTRIKGGWGPSPAGAYLVRQIGVISKPAGTVVVAMAAEPASGSFGDGTRDLNMVATWLDEHIDAFRSGSCDG